LPLKRRNVLLNKTTKIKFERVRESMCERVCVREWEREREREWYKISTEISALIGEERRKRKKSFKKVSEWCNFDVTSALCQSACERVCVCVCVCVCRLTTLSCTQTATTFISIYICVWHQKNCRSSIELQTVNSLSKYQLVGKCQKITNHQSIFGYRLVWKLIGLILLTF
jgi:hypothetical protein